MSTTKYLHLETDSTTEQDYRAGCFIGEYGVPIARLSENQLRHLIGEAQIAISTIVWLQARYGWVDGAVRGEHHHRVTTRHLVPALMEPSTSRPGQCIARYPTAAITLCGMKAPDEGWPGITAIRTESSIHEGLSWYPTCKICLRKYRRLHEHEGE